MSERNRPIYQGGRKERINEGEGENMMGEEWERIGGGGGDGGNENGVRGCWWKEEMDIVYWVSKIRVLVENNWRKWQIKWEIRSSLSELSNLPFKNWSCDGFMTYSDQNLIGKVTQDQKWVFVFVLELHILILKN